MARRPAKSKRAARPRPPGPGRGFRYTDLGPLVRDRPVAAAAQLRADLARSGGNQSAVARQYEVSYKTVVRWIQQLEAQGHAVRAAPAAA